MAGGSGDGPDELAEADADRKQVEQRLEKAGNQYAPGVPVDPGVPLDQVRAAPPAEARWPGTQHRDRNDPQRNVPEPQGHGPDGVSRVGGWARGAFAGLAQLVRHRASAG